MWRGLPHEYAEARAMALAHEAAPGSRAVVRNCELSGIDWVVRMWLFDPAASEPREARAIVRGTDGEPLGFETLA